MNTNDTTHAGLGLDDELPIKSALGPMPVIDLNTLKPAQEVRALKLGDDGKAETFDLTSVNLADSIIGGLLGGWINPLEFAVKRRVLVDALEITMKDKRVKELMTAEIGKYGRGETPTVLGATVTLVPRTTYKYDQDAGWRQLNAALQPHKDRLKAQEDRIKAACKSGGSILDEGTGEVLAAAVPSSTTETVTVSLSKPKKS